MRQGLAVALLQVGKLLAKFVDRLRSHCADGSFKNPLEAVEASHGNRHVRL